MYECAKAVYSFLCVLGAILVGRVHTFRSRSPSFLHWRKFQLTGVEAREILKAIVDSKHDPNDICTMYSTKYACRSKAV